MVYSFFRELAFIACISLRTGENTRVTSRRVSYMTIDTGTLTHGAFIRDKSG